MNVVSECSLSHCQTSLLIVAPSLKEACSSLYSSLKGFSSGGKSHLDVSSPDESEVSEPKGLTKNVNKELWFVPMKLLFASMSLLQEKV